jgi:hypothetical protein
MVTNLHFVAVVRAALVLRPTLAARLTPASTGNSYQRLRIAPALLNSIEPYLCSRSSSSAVKSCRTFLGCSCLAICRLPCFRPIINVRIIS